MRRHADNFWWLWLIVTIVLFAGATVLVVRDCNARAKCTDNGGRVVKYDCSTTFVTTTCGDGCWTTIPVETCKWRCEGANPEARP